MIGRYGSLAAPNQAIILMSAFPESGRSDHRKSAKDRRQKAGQTSGKCCGLLRGKWARYPQLLDAGAARPHLIEPASKGRQTREPINREQV